jgi:hypothetical protein
MFMVFTFWGYLAAVAFVISMLRTTARQLICPNAVAVQRGVFEVQGGA